METNFENKLTYNQILFRYANGKSLASGHEIHPYNEILYYMGGGGRLLTENFEENLISGTLIIIPKNTYHQIILTEQPKYTRFVLNFPDMDEPQVSADEIKLLYPVGKNISYLVERMCTVLKNEIKSQVTLNLLYGAFLMLLSEIRMDTPNNIMPKLRGNSELISKCIKYIDENYSTDLNIAKIAKEMNVSASALFQCFNKQLGTSVYKYITEKRMIHAHELISAGKLPTKIYTDCGYNDYATFYKAYLKMFGHVPSEDCVRYRE